MFQIIDRPDMSIYKCEACGSSFKTTNTEDIYMDKDQNYSKPSYKGYGITYALATYTQCPCCSNIFQVDINYTNTLPYNRDTNTHKKIELVSIKDGIPEHKISDYYFTNN